MSMVPCAASLVMHLLTSTVFTCAMLYTRRHDINKIGIPVDVESDCAYPGPATACISEAVKL
jgi:hypothetical protein